MTQSGRHSFLFSCGWRVIKFFIVVDVKLFMSLTISSSSFFLLPIIMWMWLGIIHLRRSPLDIHIFKPFLFLAVFPGINYCLHVFFSYENIYPVNRCERDEINFINILEFVFATHQINVQILYNFNIQKVR